MATGRTSIKGVVRDIPVDRESGWRVLSIELDPGFTCPMKGGDVNGWYKAAGLFDGKVERGDTVRLSGQWERNKWGVSFKFDDGAIALPVSQAGLASWLTQFDGIGPVTARKIAENLPGGAKGPGKSSQDLVTAGVPNESTARRIIEAWERDHLRATTISWLLGHKLTMNQASKIWEKHLGMARKLIEENPYTALMAIDGVAFKRADQMAQAFGVQFDDPRRSLAAVEWLVYEVAQSFGHTRLEIRDMIKAAQKICVQKEGVVWAAEKLADDRKLVRRAGRFYSHPTLYYAERDIAFHIQRLLDGKQPAGLSSEYRQLTNGQKQAVKLASQNSVAVINGAPGVGKTYTARYILENLYPRREDVEVMAPSGKAAQRLREVTGYEAKTIHRALEYNPAFGFQVSTLDKKAIMVDESSMVDAELFSELLKRCPDDCHVILIGDPHQLPAVGAGDVLRDLLKIKDIPSVEITEIVRQAQGSLIIENAHRILNYQKLTYSEPGQPGGVSFANSASDDVAGGKKILFQQIEQTAELYGLDKIRDIQVLIPSKTGSAGVRAVNEALGEWLNPRKKGKPTFKAGNHWLAEGDKVIYTKNNYDHDIFNGDWGFVQRIEHGNVFFAVQGGQDGEERIVKLSKQKELAPLLPAWALTVHRSQGSEYRVPLIVSVTQHAFMWSRQLLYTGLTRAKEGAVFVGEKKAIQYALGKRGNKARQTNLPAIWRDSVHNRKQLAGASQPSAVSCD